MLPWGCWRRSTTRRWSPDRGAIPRPGRCNAGDTQVAKAKQPEPQGKAEEQPKTEVDGTPKRSKSEQLRLYKARYTTYQTANGNLSMDNNDEVALALRGASPEAVMTAAEKLKGLEPGTLTARYANRNQGAKRMNAGNIIRGCVRRNTTLQQVKDALLDVSKALNTPS